MELRQVRYFEAVARHLHFTRAAEEMHVAQPALSAQIQRLEAELQVRLFERTSRTVHLTDAGSAFLPAARRVLTDIDEAHHRLRDVAELRVGHVTLGAQQSLNASGTLPPLLTRFRQQHPGINVLLTEESTPRGLTMLADGGLDLGLFHIEDDHETHDLSVEPLYEEELVFVCGESHDRENDRPRPLGSLSEEAFIVFSETAMLRRKLVQMCADAGFVPQIACESDALGSIRALASAGLGIALLPLPTVDAPGPPVRILPIDVRPRRTICLVQSAHRYQSNAASALATLLRTDLPN